jgi:dynein heavy chain 2
LDILGQEALKPTVVQRHLKKLFAGIHSVVFNNDQRQVVAVASQEGERVELKTAIAVVSEVEIWLNQLVTETSRTLQLMLLECVQERKREATDLSRFPSQILCLAEAITFAERSEKAIVTSSSALAKLKIDYQNQLTRFTSTPLLQSSGSDEHGVLMLKLQALIMDTIHYIEIIDEIIGDKCDSVSNWTWKKQLRY